VAGRPATQLLLLVCPAQLTCCPWHDCRTFQYKCALHHCNTTWCCWFWGTIQWLLPLQSSAAVLQLVYTLLRLMPRLQQASGSLPCPASSGADAVQLLLPAHCNSCMVAAAACITSAACMVLLLGSCSCLRCLPDWRATGFSTGADSMAGPVYTADHLPGPMYCTQLLRGYRHACCSCSAAPVHALPRKHTAAVPGRCSFSSLVHIISPCPFIRSIPTCERPPLT
jgi:hypothetical protein